MDRIWRRALVAPFMGALFVLALPVIGFAVPLIALVSWALDSFEAFVARGEP